MTLMVDMAEWLNVDKAQRLAMENRLEFERFIAALSTQFINLPADRVDDAIRHALQRIGESLDLDRCTFYRVLPDGVLVDPICWVRPPWPEPVAPLNADECFPWALATVRLGHCAVFSTIDDIPHPVDRESFRSTGVRSGLTVPLFVGGQIVGAVGFVMMRSARPWADETIQRLQTLALTFASVLARRESETALAKALEEVKRLSERLQVENTYLRREADEHYGTGRIIGQSAAIRGVMDLVAQVAGTDATVLLLGETGAGKELFAAEIHERSVRRRHRMVRVNCSAIPATLIESELFGHEKGAFTGATSRQLGRFEYADESTIFLDEIGELPPDVQVKLLRVLEERQIERLGSPKPIPIRTRVIAATHRDLEQRVRSGHFREDLFYRLNVFPIRIPPLRERVEDIPALVWRFVGEFSKTFDKPISEIAEDSIAALQQYSWPGNIRELRNVVERAMIVTTSPRLTIPLPASAAGASHASARLIEVEREHIRSVLETTGWRIRGAGGAAERLGLKPTTLETRLLKLGLKRPAPSHS
jgi:transcriptional regulator with GAF, ATPase, and Fis domain